MYAFCASWTTKHLNIAIIVTANHYICKLLVLPAITKEYGKMMDICQFSNFLNEHQQGFIRFAYTYVHNRMAAEDIVIESFTYYWENKDKLSDDTNISAYVLTAIKHKCIDYLRHEQVCQNVSDELYELYSWEISTRVATLENFEPYDIFTSEIQKLVDEALEGLSEQTRQIFIMSRYEHKSHNEIASILGITTKGVEFHISKTTKILRVVLRDYLPSFILYTSI